MPSFVHSYQILHIFLIKTRQKCPGKIYFQTEPNVLAKRDPEKPDARLSVPTFMRNSPSPLPVYVTKPPYIAFLTTFYLSCR